MQIVLARRLVELPGRGAEVGGPVIRLAATFGGPPDVVIAVGIVHGFAGLDEPAMLVRSVVHHQIHHQLDPTLMQPDQQLLPVGQGAEVIHDRPVVADIVPVVVVGRLVDGRQPDDVDAEILQIVELADDPAQVADAVAVAVAKAARVDLVNDAFFPPGLVHVFASPFRISSSMVLRCCWANSFALCESDSCSGSPG